MTRRLSLPVVVILLAGAWALAGCSEDGPAPSGPPAPLELVLDFTPNAVHAGTYLTGARGYDVDEGVRLRVHAPSSSTDSVKLLRAGRDDLAYLDIHDLALADARRPGELVGVMALVQRPLAALRTAPQVRRSRERSFKVDDVGAPPYPELVLVATAKTLRERRADVGAAVAALRRGHDAAFDEPGAAIDALIDAAPGIDRAAASHELAALTPALRDGEGRFGVLDRARLDAWAAWEQRSGIVERRPDVARLFDAELSGAG